MALLRLRPNIDDITTLAEEHRALNIVIETAWKGNTSGVSHVCPHRVLRAENGRNFPLKLYPLMALGIPVIFIGPLMPNRNDIDEQKLASFAKLQVNFSKL